MTSLVPDVNEPLVFHEPNIRDLHKQVQYLQARLGQLIDYVYDLEDRLDNASTSNTKEQTRQN